MHDFYKLKELDKKLLKPYESGHIFTAFIEKKECFPLSFPLPKFKESHIQQSYTEVLKNIQSLEKKGLPVVYEKSYFKTIGAQSVPSKIEFATREGYLIAIDKVKEYALFTSLFVQITSRFEALDRFFLLKPFLVLELAHCWREILDVVDFLLQNPSPHIYTREISIEGVDTKFIEKHCKIIDALVSFLQDKVPLSRLSDYAFEKRYHLSYPEPLVRFRILDETLFLQGMCDISIPLSQFSNLALPCKKVFIVENKITTLSFPLCKEAIVIFGSGYALSSLGLASWLHEKEMYYWGDIDSDGFAILSMLRGYFSHVRSFLMDKETLLCFKKLITRAPSVSKPRELKCLSQQEVELYTELIDDIHAKNLRLEQEKIPFDYVKSIIFGL